MTLRHSLDTVFGLLGILLLAVAGSLLTMLVRTERDHAAEALAAAQRDALFQLCYTARTEESATLEALVGETDFARGASDLSAQAATDAAMNRARATFADSRDAGTSALLGIVGDSLSQGRAALPNGTAGAASARTLDDWYRSRAPQTRAFAQLSRFLAESAHDADGTTGLVAHSLAALRGLGLNAHRDLLNNRILIEGLLAERDAAALPVQRFALLNSLRATTAAAIGAAGQATDHARLAPGPATDPAVQALDLLAESYAPAEDALLDSFARGLRPDAEHIRLWRDASRGSLQEFEHAEAELAATGRALFERRRAESRLFLGTGSLLALASLGLAALAARTVSRSVLRPLDRISARLGLLVTGAERQPDPSRSSRAARPARTGRPARAILTRLQANLGLLEEAVARDRFRQAELARLSDHAVTGNREMLADLEAAARVQRGQLPPSPRMVPGAAFHALYRPSRIVAGDTYDCITRRDGRTTVFQIDVAGHGAPAAIVSVAAHVALKQALLSAPPGEALARTIARVNSTWADDLPYFTLLAVEIDPATATAQIVQCGHPALLRLPADGGIEALGNGGLPIGVLPDAEFETLACPFASGDRLVLVTDGLSEAADPKGRPFGDTRLRDLLLARPRPEPAALFDRIERALWDWRGTDTPDDDVTILLLEAR